MSKEGNEPRDRKEHDQSRRHFLTSMGALAVGAAAGSYAMAGVATASTQEAPGLPWTYKPLDPEKVGKLAHLGYYKAECCYGVFSALVDSLKEAVGFPYTTIPTHMMHYGGGGVSGWCTLCGALNGACAAINLVSDKEKELCDELLKWYAQTPLPSQASNEMAVNHAFLVDKYKSDIMLPQTVSNSPLCHNSVTVWCKASGFASGSSERSERCARACADVAAFTTEMLNKAHAGQFTPAYAYSETTQRCRACHHKGKDFEAGQWTRGKMHCAGCHSKGVAELVGSEHP